MPNGSPPIARGGHTAVYDPNSDRMIIFGGNQAGNLPSNDRWVLTNANGIGGTSQWIKIEPANQPPSARWGHVAVYDPIMNRMVVFGGSNWEAGLNDTWVLTNANGAEATTPAWIQLAPGGTLPPARNQFGAGYSATNKRMVIFGGDTSYGCCVLLNDLWLLTDATGFIDTIPPAINNVTLNTTTPNTGQAILVTLNAIDDAGVTSVEANGTPLAVQGEDTFIWSGIISAIEGAHHVNVSARDAAGNVAWDKSTSYYATTLKGDINNNGQFADAGDLEPIRKVNNGMCKSYNRSIIFKHPFR